MLESSDYFRRHLSSYFVESRADFKDVKIDNKLKFKFELDFDQLCKIINSEDYMPSVIVDQLDNIIAELKYFCNLGNVLIFDPKISCEKFKDEDAKDGRYITLTDPYTGIVFSLFKSSELTDSLKTKFILFCIFGYTKGGKIISGLSNCKNCGAAPKRRVCEYCGTVQF